MTIEGILEFERLRDFLYSKMRGTKGPAGAPAPAVSAVSTHSDLATGPPDDDLAAILREVAAEVRALRTAIEADRSKGSDA